MQKRSRTFHSGTAKQEGPAACGRTRSAWSRSSSWRSPRPLRSPPWSATCRSRSARQRHRRTGRLPGGDRGAEPVRAGHPRWPAHHGPGAFYGFISYGLGRVIGLGAGALTTMAYIVFEASLVGIFSFFADELLRQPPRARHPLAGVRPAACWLANALATYFKINLAASVLGVFLVSEIVMLALMTLHRAVHRRRPGRVVAGVAEPAERLHQPGGLGRRTRPTPAATLAVAGSAGHRPVLRVLVLGRVRVGGDVRRGVARPDRRSSRGPPCCRWSASASST